MKMQSFKSIGIQVNQIFFEDPTSCKIYGKTFIENGYYNSEVTLSLYQLRVLMEHHGHVGRILQMIIKSDPLIQKGEFPAVIDLVQSLGNGLLFQADELEMMKVKSIIGNDKQMRYRLQVEKIRKCNKLKMLKNIRKILQMNAIPNDRIIGDEVSLREAYESYELYTSMDMQDEQARIKTGLSNPLLFSMAKLYQSA